MHELTDVLQGRAVDLLPPLSLDVETSSSLSALFPPPLLPLARVAAHSGGTLQCHSKWPPSNFWQHRRGQTGAPALSYTSLPVFLCSRRHVCFPLSSSGWRLVSVGSFISVFSSVFSSDSPDFCSPLYFILFDQFFACGHLIFPLFLSQEDSVS